jgi:hypothetical protein
VASVVGVPTEIVVLEKVTLTMFNVELPANVLK